MQFLCSRKYNCSTFQTQLSKLKSFSSGSSSFFRNCHAEKVHDQERIKGTEKASPIHTLFHRTGNSSRVIFRIGLKLSRALRGCLVEVSYD